MRFVLPLLFLSHCAYAHVAYKPRARILAPDSERTVVVNGDTCPTVTPVPTEIASRFNIDTNYYKKYVEAVGGIPVVSSDKVSDAALLLVRND